MDLNGSTRLLNARLSIGRAAVTPVALATAAPIITGAFTASWATGKLLGRVRARA